MTEIELCIMWAHRAQGVAKKPQVVRFYELCEKALRAQQEQSNQCTNGEPDVEEYEEMTIEAAIKHCEEVSRRSPCTPCEREHMRLAAWLTELVSLRAQQKPNEPLTGPLKIGDSFHGMKIIALDALAGTITLSGWESFYCKLEQEKKEQIHDSD